MKRRIQTAMTFLAVAGVLLAACPGASPAEPPALAEYEAEALLLLKTLPFVDWPYGSLSSNSTAIAIGVLGNEQLGRFLDQLVEGEIVKERKLVVKRSRRLEDLKGCQVVFVSRAEAARVSQILRELRASGTLTAGDSEQFTRQGGVMRFYLEGKKPRLEINTDASRCQGLIIDARMLQLPIIRVGYWGCGQEGR